MSEQRIAPAQHASASSLSQPVPLLAHRSLPSLLACGTDSHLRASPSQYPRKKYCDVSHLPALYTDPSTRLHYCDAFRFAIVRSLSREQVNARLALRRAQLGEIK